MFGEGIPPSRQNPGFHPSFTIAICYTNLLLDPALQFYIMETTVTAYFKAGPILTVQHIWAQLYRYTTTLLGLYPRCRAVSGIKGEDMPTYANRTHANQSQMHPYIDYPILDWNGRMDQGIDFQKCLKRSFHSEFDFLALLLLLLLVLACVQAFSSIPISEACPGPRYCFIAVFCQLSLALGPLICLSWPQVSLVDSL